MIEVRAVHKTYRRLPRGKKTALDGVDLDVRRGEVFGLIGPNGAGKTTLLTCLLGLLRPDRGTIIIDGRPPEDLSVREKTGYLPERLGFDRELTGRQFLALHARLAGLSSETLTRAVAEGAQQVDVPAEALGRPLKTYSRGMLQRIGLAQALLGRPALLFLDEPASGMDPAGVAIVRRLILEAKGAGATVLLNSHQLQEVERVCDRVAFIDRGRVSHLESLRDEGRQHKTWRLRVKAGQEEQALQALRTRGLSVQPARDGRLRVQGGEEDLEVIGPTLAEVGLVLLELTEWSAQLEALFLGEAGGV